MRSIFDQNHIPGFLTDLKYKTGELAKEEDSKTGKVVEDRGFDIVRVMEMKNILN